MIVIDNLQKGHRDSVLPEAMSYGLSCIASDIPANRDVVLLAEDRFFKAGDINNLMKKIEKYIHKPLTDEETKIQLKEVSEKYNWDKIILHPIK